MTEVEENQQPKPENQDNEELELEIQYNEDMMKVYEHYLLQNKEIQEHIQKLMEAKVEIENTSGV